MIFLNDFVYGYLHPGNILVTGMYPNLKMHLLATHQCGQSLGRLYPMELWRDN
jgi:hypothetical protein